MKSQYYSILLVLVVLIFISGCFPTNEFEFIERVIKSELTSAHFKTVIEFSFGPVSLSTARMFVNFADADRTAAEILAEVKRVQVGVYELRHDDYHNRKIYVPEKVKTELEKKEYQLFVRVKERDEHVELYYKQLNKFAGSIYIIVLEEEELVIVEVRGNLEKMIEKTIQQHGIPGGAHISFS